MTDEWIGPMQPALKVNYNGAMAFFISAMFIGRYLLMNFLFTIVLNAVDETPSDAIDGSVAIASAADSHAKAEEVGGATSAVVASANDVAVEIGMEVAAAALTSAQVDAKTEASPSTCDVGCWAWKNRVRAACQALVAQPSFDWTVGVVIAASSVCLALDSPRNDPDSTLAMRLRQLDLVWLSIFGVEMLVKIAAFGFVRGEDAYLRSPWNVLDFTIVGVSFLALAAETFPQLRPLRTLRILRVLRPLRLLAR